MGERRQPVPFFYFILFLPSLPLLPVSRHRLLFNLVELAPTPPQLALPFRLPIGPDSRAFHTLGGIARKALAALSLGNTTALLADIFIYQVPGLAATAGGSERESRNQLPTTDALFIQSK